jgi:hypothetical protein
VKAQDVNALMDRLRRELVASPSASTVGIVGFTPTTLILLEMLNNVKGMSSVTGVYAGDAARLIGPVPLRPMKELRTDRPAIAIIASDEGKEQLLADAVTHLSPETRVLISGFSHFDFADPIFSGEIGGALIPSFANGYPNSLIHIYQCLKNAARLRLQGIVTEFGMFKGGTTMLMSRFIERLGAAWKVYGFDSFAGFPPRRSALDMYSHPDCVYLDETMVRRMFEGRNVEIIAGDIVQTVVRIKDAPIVLAFVDTDNFTPAAAILDVIQDQIVPGGAIVFDHFTGRDRFLYTIGERMAAKPLLEDSRYFNLHDTGVFLRQR